MDNQTNPNWLRDTREDAPGTGIFLLPDVFSEIYGDMVALAVPRLTYAACIQRGSLAVGFKWVPETVAGFEEILNALGCGGPCVETCSQPGCICNRYRGRCVKAISGRDLGAYWSNLPPSPPRGPDQPGPEDDSLRNLLRPGLK